MADQRIRYGDRKFSSPKDAAKAIRVSMKEENWARAKVGLKPNGDYSKYVASVGSYKRGGKIKKTGMAKVHKGERVLTKKQQVKLGMKSRMKKSKKEGAKNYAKKIRKYS